MRTIWNGFKILGRSYMTAIRIICLTILLVFITGCAARQKNVTNLPAGATLTEVQQWDEAVANLDKVASFTSTARQAVIAANKSGAFPDGPQYATTLQALGRVDELQLSASTLLKATPNNFSASTKSQVQALTQQISQQLIALNTSGLVGIKNPTTQQEVGSLISNISAAVALILSL